MESSGVKPKAFVRCFGCCCSHQRVRIQGFWVQFCSRTKLERTLSRPMGRCLETQTARQLILVPSPFVIFIFQRSIVASLSLLRKPSPMGAFVLPLFFHYCDLLPLVQEKIETQTILSTQSKTAQPDPKDETTTERQGQAHDRGSKQIRPVFWPYPAPASHVLRLSRRLWWHQALHSFIQRSTTHRTFRPAIEKNWLHHLQVRRQAR